MSKVIKIFIQKKAIGPNPVNMSGAKVANNNPILNKIDNNDNSSPCGCKKKLKKIIMSEE